MMQDVLICRFQLYDCDVFIEVNVWFIVESQVFICVCVFNIECVWIFEFVGVVVCGGIIYYYFVVFVECLVIEIGILCYSLVYIGYWINYLYSFIDEIWEQLWIGYQFFVFRYVFCDQFYGFGQRILCGVVVSENNQQLGIVEEFVR